MQIEIKKLEEAGYIPALFGIGKNKGLTSGMDINELCNRTHVHLFSRLEGIAAKLAVSGQGHSKFLRQIAVWFEIRAPRYWWAEMDTYKAGTAAQSESTIYTIRKGVTWEDFEDGDIQYTQLETIKDRIKYNEPLESIKRALPESFMQTRVWSANYEVLRNIFQQRRNHPLPHWKRFIEQVTEQVDHPELLKIGAKHDMGA